MKEACGVFGVYAPGRGVAHLTFDGIYALQHRGQESAGMAVNDGHSITVVKDMGLVTSVFDEHKLACLPGYMAIGHTRYSTTGSSSWRNAQPVFRASGTSGFALAHNGNLTNTAELLDNAGMLPGVLASDSDLIAELVFTHLHVPAPGDLPVTTAAAPMTAPATAPQLQHEDLLESLRAVVPTLKGAFSLALVDGTSVIGIRDPNGFRPLCLGSLGDPANPDGWVIASETPALDIIGATFVREIEPGEMVVIDHEGPHSERIFAESRIEPKLCIFEFVYFARPDTRLYGREVHGARRKMGEMLAQQSPVEADMVMGVPDSGLPAAEGYALRSGIPYGQGLVKNRYIGRTFIAPDQAARVAGVRRKLNPLKENISGKRLIVVDDSVVRGTTTRSMVKMLRDAGAAEVHLRISSPPFKWPCFYGIDTPDRDELLAAHRSIDDIREYLSVDSVAYLTLENLEAAIGAPGAGFCSACLSGKYPVPVPAAPLVPEAIS